MITEQTVKTSKLSLTFIIFHSFKLPARQTTESLKSFRSPKSLKEGSNAHRNTIPASEEHDIIFDP